MKTYKDIKKTKSEMAQPGLNAAVSFVTSEVMRKGKGLGSSIKNAAKKYKLDVKQLTKTMRDEFDFLTDAEWKTSMKEDAPVNSSGAGNVAGIGVGADGEPGRKKKKKTEDQSKAGRRLLGFKEKVDPDASMIDYIHDFEKSDAPQFKGKTKEKRREMAIAAKLSKEETVKNIITRVRMKENMDKKYVIKLRGKIISSHTTESDARTEFRKLSKDAMSEPLFRSSDLPDLSTEHGHSGVVIVVKEEQDTFAGTPVFDVDTNTLLKCRQGRNKYERWKKFVDEDTDIGRQVKEYSQKNPSSGIVLRDQTGAMMYLRHRQDMA